MAFFFILVFGITFFCRVDKIWAKCLKLSEFLFMSSTHWFVIIFSIFWTFRFPHPPNAKSALHLCWLIQMVQNDSFHRHNTFSGLSFIWRDQSFSIILWICLTGGSLLLYCQEITLSSYIYYLANFVLYTTFSVQLHHPPPTIHHNYLFT